MTAVLSLGQSRFRLGAVVSQSLSVLAGNIVPFGALYLAVNAPSSLIALMTAGDPGADTDAVPRLLWIVESFVGLVAAAVITFGTVHELRGQRLGFGRFFGRGLAQGGAAIGAALLSGIGVLLGCILLIVPGLVLYTMWWVAVPAAVIERPGASASLRRSAALTKGYRWQIFGLAVAFIAAMLLAGVVIGFAVGGLMTLAPGADLVLLTQAAILLEWLLTALFMAAQAVLGAVTYYHLRVAKEGIGIDAIAAVFD
jgi:uncharacterized membrane protein